MTNQEKVAIFTRLAGQPTPNRICLCNERTAKLRYELIHEELQELQHAQAKQDIVGIADAIADLLYVVYGAAVAYGIPAQQVFDEVHRSNMSKFIDGHRREDGKWVKGPSYSPANLKPILGLE